MSTVLDRWMRGNSRTMEGVARASHLAAPSDEDWRNYTEATNRSADMMGIRSSQREPDPVARKSFLQQRSGDLSYSPEYRRSAASELAGIQKRDNSAQEQEWRMALANVNRPVPEPEFVPMQDGSGALNRRTGEIVGNPNQRDPKPWAGVLKPGERAWDGERFIEGPEAPVPVPDPEYSPLPDGSGALNRRTGEIVGNPNQRDPKPWAGVLKAGERAWDGERFIEGPEAKMMETLQDIPLPMLLDAYKNAQYGEGGKALWAEIERRQQAAEVRNSAAAAPQAPVAGGSSSNAVEPQGGRRRIRFD